MRSAKASGDPRAHRPPVCAGTGGISCPYVFRHWPSHTCINFYIEGAVPGPVPCCDTAYSLQIFRWCA